MPLSLDDLRRQFPRFTSNVYAPAGGNVTLEIIGADDEVTHFEGRTLAACIRRAFGYAVPEAPATPPEPPGLFD